MANVLNDYVAGAISGAAGLIVGHPFDTTKVQLQTATSSSSSQGTVATVRNISQHGLARGFFRGLGFPLVSYGVVNSVFFGVYGNVGRFLTNDSSSSYGKIFVAGCAGGAAQLFVACPVDAVKVVLQSQIPRGGTSGVGRPSYFRGPAQCIRMLYRYGGLRTCYKGMSVMAVRDIPASGAYFLSYEVMYEHMMKYGLSDRSGTLASLSAGGFAGVFSWIIIFPIDVIKSKVQADYTREKYSSAWHCAKVTFKDGGIRPFFKGAVVNSIRAFGTNAVIFFVHKKAMEFLSPSSGIAGSEVMIY